MSATSIASSWKTKRLLHLVKSRKQFNDNRNYTEDQIVYIALELLAKELNVQLPKEGSQENKQEVVCYE